MAFTAAVWHRSRAGLGAAAVALACLMPAPARADFLDDVRRTFQTDIPHFFQDDIPCAFGGQPTSHTKTSCKSPKSAGNPASTQTGDRTANPSAKPNDVKGEAARSGR